MAFWVVRPIVLRSDMTNRPSVSQLSKFDGWQCPTPDSPIGVFDSGVGGLTVLQAIQNRLPQESILYFGDTANVPYGTKSPEEILMLVRDILQWMTAYPVRMVVMACNTSSALALETVQAEFDVPILGVILPAARAAVQVGDRIGVIATPATAASHAYAHAIQEINPHAHVVEVGCPEFVPIIEQNQIHTPQTYAIVQRYLHPLIEQGIDTLIYGCTHYPHLAPVIRRILPPSVNVIDPAHHAAIATAQELKLLGCSNSGGERSATSARINFFVSDRPQRFTTLTSHLLGYEPVVETVRPKAEAPQYLVNREKNITDR